MKALDKCVMVVCLRCCMPFCFSIFGHINMAVEEVGPTCGLPRARPHLRKAKPNHVLKTSFSPRLATVYQVVG